MIKKSSLTETIEFQSNTVKKANKGLKRNLLLELNVKPKNYALIISGIRRCGKSTLLNQYIAANIKEAYLYLNFDAASLYSFEIDDFKLLDEIISEKACKWLVFDEIQVVVGWEIYIRQKIDEGFYVLITGSNASLLSRELGTKLTGRHNTKELFPFSYREFCSFKKNKASEKTLNLYLAMGGLPGFLTTGNSELHTSLIDDIIYRDIAVRHNIRDVKSIKHLLVFIAFNCSKLISANKVKQYIAVKSTATVLEYLHYFEESYLIQLIPKFSYSQKVQLVNPRKAYFIDNGLQLAITGSFSNDLGRKLENMVFWELRRKGKKLYYFNENNKECDFVVCQQEQVEQVIQVCSLLDLENEQREINGLLEAMNFFNLNTGYIITLNKKDVILIEGKRIEVIPAYKYFG